jgi:DNA-binding PucR family transcriptional regulator
MLVTTIDVPELERLNKSSEKDDPRRLRPAWREVDPALADALRPALPGLVDEVIAAVEAAVPEYRGGVEANVRLGVRQALDGFAELVETGSEERLPERQIYFEFGRGEFRVGRSLDALLRAYRAGAQVAWRGLADAGDRAGLDPRALYTLAEAIFAYIDEISAASAEGFAREQSLAVSERHARRRRLVELLLREPAAAPEAIEQAAADAGWGLPARLAVLALDAEQPERIAARLPTGTVVGELEAKPVAVIPDPDGPGRRAVVERALEGARGGLGHTVEWPEAPRSAGRARLALAAADGPGLTVGDERLLDLLLLRDEGLTADLVERRLRPLLELPAARRERLSETLAAWLDAHGEARPAAERLHVHVQTVRYRLARLRELLGDTLDDPAARLELALALRALRGGRRAPAAAGPLSP